MGGYGQLLACVAIGGSAHQLCQLIGIPGNPSQTGQQIWLSRGSNSARHFTPPVAERQTRQMPTILFFSLGNPTTSAVEPRPAVPTKKQDRAKLTCRSAQRQQTERQRTLRCAPQRHCKYVQQDTPFPVATVCVGFLAPAPQRRDTKPQQLPNCRRYRSCFLPLSTEMFFKNYCNFE